MVSLLTINPYFMDCRSIRYVKTVLMHLYGYSMPGKASLSGKVDYCPIRTDLHTFSTGGTLIIINYCKIILHMNSIVWTYFFALFTGNTRILTNLLRNCTFIERLASYMHHLGFWHYTDKLPGANGSTLSAGSTALFNYPGEVILTHIHRLKFTGLYARTQTQTTIITAKKTTSDNVCCTTVLNPIISKLIFYASCMAHYNSNRTFLIFEFDTHYVRNKLGHCSLSHRTTTYGSFAFHYGLCKTATTRLTTCATICTWQDFIDTINTRINLDRKSIRGNSQPYSKDHA